MSFEFNDDDDDDGFVGLFVALMTGASIGTLAEFTVEQRNREQRTTANTTAATTMTSSNSMHLDVPASSKTLTKPLRVSFTGHSQV